jgi:signal transduction histidine kinase
MPHELAWTIIELDLDYVRAYLLPELLQRHLGNGETHDYYVELVAKDKPSTVIYNSNPNQSAGMHPDASVSIFEAPFDGFGRPDGPGMRRIGRGPMPALAPERGRWLLSVRHRSGSLETLVAQTRRRSLAITTAILLLMLAAAAALIVFTRRAQRLAELQMEFVAGVSHELRTPLSVIRMASHNLGVRVISNASRVQRYGALIEEQSQKLTDVVEQVLLFSNARAGRVIQSKETVSVQFLVDEALKACTKAVVESRCTVECVVDPGLAVRGDATALKHALLNLISNAAKYGAEGGWIGVYATAITAGRTPMVEIAVADRGPGIPRRELDHIFDPFYRGKMAVSDQIHGTGLGLSLVKRIVKAHGGAVSVSSEPAKETRFVIRLPAAPAEQIDEFADSVSRR